MQFEKGDIVKLKSGGPKMSVQRVNNKDSGTINLPAFSLRAQWFAGSTLKEGTFPFESLEKIENGNN